MKSMILGFVFGSLFTATAVWAIHTPDHATIFPEGSFLDRMDRQDANEAREQLRQLEQRRSLGLNPC